MGNTVFVSHQWVCRTHPDPEFRQMRVLQAALQRVMYSKGSVFLNFITETFVPGAKGISHKEFQSKQMFLWYDYFSVPQAGSNSHQQTDAIKSIPAYVGRSRFFFALCPTIESPTLGKILSASSWAKRGQAALSSALFFLGKGFRV